MASRTPLRVAVFALVIAGATVARGSMQTHGEPERFTAFAVSTGGPYTRSGSATVQINIERWSTEAERQTLVQTLQEKGPNALLDALQDMKEVGTVRTPDSLGYPLHYANQTAAEEGGRKIVIATDRPISFWEAVNRPRTIDYPFTLIQMEIGKDGTGNGRMSYATKIIAHDNIIELENFAAQPIMLNNVRSETWR
jgi:hypothetical protein